MNEQHKYSFDPSILRTNSQISREASRVLYIENCLIRVGSAGPWYNEGLFSDHNIGHAVPILASGEQAVRFTNHMVEIVTVHEENLQNRIDARLGVECFIIAGDDLSRLCQTLLVMNVHDDHASLDRLTLAIEVRNNGTAATVVPSKAGETLMNSDDLESIDDSSEAKDDEWDRNDISNEREAQSPETMLMGEQTETPGKWATSTSSYPRVLRQLEPLRRLHSLQGVHITGQISNDDKTKLLLDMLGPPPTDEELFDISLGRFEDAMRAYETNDRDAAFYKSKLTLDTIRDQEDTRPVDWAGTAVISTGSYRGYTVRDAEEDVKRQIWTKFAWAYVEDPCTLNEWAAKRHVELIIGRDDESDSYWNSPPMGHKGAMAFYLAARVLETVGHVGCHSQISYLSDVVRCLVEGLRHEPANHILKLYHKRTENELRKAKEVERMLEEIEDLMGMWERLSEEEGVDWPSGSEVDDSPW